MQIIHSIDEMQTLSENLRKQGRSIGFVPTMGFLHEGHLSLVDLLTDRTDTSILSIFVNPTQFSEGEDLEKYPHDLDRDLKLCQEREVDIVFIPERKKMYSLNHSTSIEEESLLQNYAEHPDPHISRESLQSVQSYSIYVSPILWCWGRRMRSKS